MQQLFRIAPTPQKQLETAIRPTHYPHCFMGSAWQGMLGDQGALQSETQRNGIRFASVSHVSAKTSHQFFRYPHFSFRFVSLRYFSFRFVSLPYFSFASEFFFSFRFASLFCFSVGYFSVRFFLSASEFFFSFRFGFRIFLFAATVFFVSLQSKNRQRLFSHYLSSKYSFRFFCFFRLASCISFRFAFFDSLRFNSFSFRL